MRSEPKIVHPRRLRRPDTSEPLVAFAEALARVASGGGGPQALAAHLAATLGAAVLVEDIEGRHLALAGTGARSVPSAVRPLLPADLEDAERGLPLAPPADAAARAFPVRAGEARLGWLALFGAAEPGADGEALARLCAAQIAVELARDGAGGRGRRRSFWDRLLARAYDDAIELREDAHARGIALAPAYVAVALEAEGLDESVAASRNAEVRRVGLDVLGSRGGEIVVIERGGGFLFLCPTPHEVDAQNARTAATLIPRGLARAGLDVQVVGGVGRHAEALRLGDSVDQAREALTIARRMYGGGRIASYDDLGVYPLLHRSGVTREEWAAFATRVLAPLRAYDEKHQTELVRTLRLFFGVGQNIKVAAAELNVHRHTVFYRLRQISEIGALDLDSPHDQLTVRAALAVDALA